MVTLYWLHGRCEEFLKKMPCGWRPVIPPGTSSATILETLHQFDVRERERIDLIVRGLVLDWKVFDETEPTWFLIEQRARGAVYFLEHLLLTLDDERQLCLAKVSQDYSVEWALVKLWAFSGPLWMQRAARLLAAGMDLSSRESPPV